MSTALIEYSDLNIREKMKLISHWLGDQEEDISDGLKSINDAEKMYLFAIDINGADCTDTDEWGEELFVKAIGYCPTPSY